MTTNGHQRTPRRERTADRQSASTTAPNEARDATETPKPADYVRWGCISTEAIADLDAREKLSNEKTHETLAVDAKP